MPINQLVPHPMIATLSPLAGSRLSISGSSAAAERHDSAWEASSMSTKVSVMGSLSEAVKGSELIMIDSIKISQVQSLNAHVWATRVIAVRPLLNGPVMTQQHRLNALLELVSERGTISIAEISEELGTSAATARRDLTALAEQHLLTRTHGGAVALGTGYELPLQYKIARQGEAKVAIAQAASRLVSVGESIGLNGGTTTSEVARALGRSPHLMGKDVEIGLTVVTNALNIGYELAVRPHIKIVVTGGIARRQSYELVGSIVTNTLDDLALDAVFLGVDGLSEQFGATTLHDGEAEVSQAFVRVAKKVIVVADSTKLERTTIARICTLAQIDVLVTDQPVTGGLAAALSAANVRVVLP
jgi:DeoR family transcriptional regulator of aga operon